MTTVLTSVQSEYSDAVTTLNAGDQRLQMTVEMYLVPGLIVGFIILIANRGRAE